MSIGTFTYVSFISKKGSVFLSELSTISRWVQNRGGEEGSVCRASNCSGPDKIGAEDWFNNVCSIQL